MVESGKLTAWIGYLDRELADTFKFNREVYSGKGFGTEERPDLLSFAPSLVSAAEIEENLHGDFQFQEGLHIPGLSEGA